MCITVGVGATVPASSDLLDADGVDRAPGKHEQRHGRYEPLGHEIPFAHLVVVHTQVLQVVHLQQQDRRGDVAHEALKARDAQAADDEPSGERDGDARPEQDVQQVRLPPLAATTESLLPEQTRRVQVELPALEQEVKGGPVAAGSAALHLTYHLLMPFSLLLLEAARPLGEDDMASGDQKQREERRPHQ